MTAVASGRDRVAEGAEQTLWQRIDREDLIRAVFVAACALAVASGVTWPAPQLPVIAVVGVVVGCWPIVTEAWHDVRSRRMSMELSMLIAIVAAAAIGEWTTALVITAFVLAAEILEDLSMARGRDALTDLMSFLPAVVQLRDGDGLRSVPLTDLAAGQVVVVAPGGRIPVDGVVVAGESTADQSRITGESAPVDLVAGDEVYAGSINQVGALEIRVDRVGAASYYGRIVEAVREAQSSEPPVQRLADRLTAWLVYLALAGAALTYLFTRDLTATISVVVVAGACGIAAGTPLAVLAAIARIARSGAFVKDGAHLEALSAIDTIAFDKTGTLTSGAPTVVGVYPATGVEAGELLDVAASAEAYSEHPVGKAITAHALASGARLQPSDAFSYRPGFGVSATVAGRRITAGTDRLVPDAPERTVGDHGGTLVRVGIDGVYAGAIELADEARPGAREAIAALHGMGLRTMMITGDQARVAQRIADELGIDDVRAELLPDDKLAAIGTERTAGYRLAMVGDGVNDAPALSAADVGIAMGSGTDIATESADVVLISSSFQDLVTTVQVARRARRIVLANFVGTVAIDLIGMLLAGFGVIGPVAAAFVHVGSETAFILNSARLIPGRRRGNDRALSLPRTGS